MKKILLILVAAFAVIGVKAQESGNYYLYAYDKTNSSNIYIQLTSTDGDIYSATGNTFNSSTDLSSIQVIYGNWETTYAPAANTWPEVTLDGDAISLEQGGSGSGWVYGWTLAESNYVYFQLSTLKLAITSDSTNPFASSTAISKVSAENGGVAEYYNLQGVRQVNPSKGVYIKKQGGKTSKVMIK